MKSAWIVRINKAVYLIFDVALTNFKTRNVHCIKFVILAESHCRLFSYQKVFHEDFFVVNCTLHIYQNIHNRKRSDGKMFGHFRTFFSVAESFVKRHITPYPSLVRRFVSAYIGPGNEINIRRRLYYPHYKCQQSVDLYFSWMAS